MDRVITRRYRTDAVTVIWQPDKCSHDQRSVVQGTVRVRAADGSHGVVGFKG